MTDQEYNANWIDDGEVAIGVERSKAIEFTFAEAMEERNRFEKTLYYVYQKSIEDNRTSIVDYDGLLWACSRSSVFKIRVREIWVQSHYQSALHYSHHFELTKKLVEYRKDRFGDVEIILEQKEGDCYKLEYVINTNISSNLLEAYDYGSKLNSWISSETDKLHVAVGKLYIDAIIKIDDNYLLDIPRLISLVESSTNANEKGKALETLIHKLFEEIEGFSVRDRIRTTTEEIDLLILNHSDNEIWSKESPLILVECKNWSSKCGKNELVLFKEKLENRSGRAKLGFIISWNGFSSKLSIELLRSSKSDIVIVPLTGKEIKLSIENESFGQLLEKSWLSSVNN